MAVFEAADAGTITLAFSAPGDDELVGTASRYLLATAGADPDSEAAWDAAKPVEVPLVPLKRGVVQALTLEGLAAGRYHFALRAEDEAGNLAPVGDSPGIDVD